jgi:hypothetical protein
VTGGVNPDKTGQFPFLGGVKGADGDTVFEDARRFGEGFALEGEGGPVVFKGAVDGGRAYGHQLFPDGGRNAEGGPQGDIIRLLAHERREQLLAFIPEGGPDEVEGGEDLVGVDFFALPIGRLWLGGFESGRAAFRE